MVHLIAKLHAEALSDSAWLRDVLSAFDVVTALSDALTPTWTVQREIDHAGDLSIVVLPEPDDTALPSFVLYEGDGLVQVATIVGEDWQNTLSYPSCQRAVAAIAAAAAAASPESVIAANQRFVSAS
jgi:hypothetical protein